MKPSIGRIVIYRPTEAEKKVMADTIGCNTSDILPATIVAVWGDSEESCINVKVHQDGDVPDLWKTSINRGEEPGQWNWPERV